MVISPNACPAPCPQHGAGQYQDSLTCPICRAAAKEWLSWAVFEVKYAFNAVAFTGSSGAAFGYWLADEFGLKPVQIFKPDEKRHGAAGKLDRFETTYAKAGWVFLDDFIGCGDTLKRVIEVMGSKPKAVLCYMSGVSTYYQGLSQTGIQCLARP